MAAVAKSLGVVGDMPVVKAIADRLSGSIGKVALAVKYAQNCTIPIVAIVLAYIASRFGGFEARLPLAVLLMLLASMAAMFVHLPQAVQDSLHAARKWLLAPAMVVTSMTTPIEALKKPDVRNAILVLIAIEFVNIIVVYALTSALLA